MFLAKYLPRVLFFSCVCVFFQAVKSGGPNEDTNRLLAETIKEAKHNSVPKDNITRAIKRAVDGSQGDFKEVVYEVCLCVLHVLSLLGPAYVWRPK